MRVGAGKRDDHRLVVVADLHGAGPDRAEVDDSVDGADPEELHSLTGDGAGHVFHVFLQVEGHLELGLGGMEIGQVAEFSEHGRRGMVLGHRRERRMEQLKANYTCHYHASDDRSTT